MCGIAGWVAREPLPAENLDRALGELAARGPDGRGTWRSGRGEVFFGHTRLAILDCSERGAQPFIAPDGASAFVHNGEVYNFRELRSRLESSGERFVSDSDGEVVARLLALGGELGLPQLEGMFALAFWDGRGGRLLLARDHFGIKPLYYAELPRGLAFASQPKALLAMARLSPQLDPEALGDFLSYGYVPFDRSIFLGIRKLPPAHRLTYEPETGRLEVRPFWRLERRQVRDDPDELRSLLEQAVTSHLVSDVPLGAFLSGGLDSTTVVSIAARRHPGLPTFAVAYGDGDDADLLYAREAGRALQTRHRDWILRMEGLETALARSAEIYDEPLYDPRGLAMLDLSRLSRRTVKVALTGDGGDEVFGGYGWHETVMRYESRRQRWRGLREPFASFWRGVVRPVAARPFAARLAGSARLLAPDFAERYFAVRGFFTADEQRRVLGRARDDVERLFRRFDRPDLPLAHRLTWMDLHTYLPDNGLVLVDRSTMAHGLEARVPLLDRRLVEYAFSLAPERLVEPGSTKVAFREAAEPLVPEAIRTRPKSGFSPPFKRWVRGARRQSALGILERGFLASDGVIDPRAVRAIVEGGAQRRYNKLWLLLGLEAWYARWIRGKELPEAPELPAEAGVAGRAPGGLEEAGGGGAVML